MAEYIERTAAYSLAKKICDAIDKVPRCILGHDILDFIDDIPAADVRPVVRGKWYWDEDGMDWGIGSWRCSVCHSRPETRWQGDRTNPRNKSGHYYCPNCGADMREES